MDSVMNFHHNTLFAWDHFQRRVEDGFRVKVRHKATGAPLNETQLVEAFARYQDDFLFSLTFQQSVTLFEAFFFDFLKMLLVHEPRHLASRKQIEVGFALSARDRSSLIEPIADRELNELKYRRPKEWFDYLFSLINIACPSKDEIHAFAEIKASRDLLVHNSGLVNQTYLDKSEGGARFALAQKLQIPAKYHRQSWGLLKKVIDDITVATNARMSKAGK